MTQQPLTYPNHLKKFKKFKKFQQQQHQVLSEGLVYWSRWRLHWLWRWWLFCVEWWWKWLWIPLSARMLQFFVITNEVSWFGHQGLYSSPSLSGLCAWCPTMGYFVRFLHTLHIFRSKFSYDRPSSDGWYLGDYLTCVPIPQDLNTLAHIKQYMRDVIFNYVLEWNVLVLREVYFAGSVLVAPLGSVTHESWVMRHESASVLVAPLVSACVVYWWSSIPTITLCPLFGDLSFLESTIHHVIRPFPHNSFATIVSFRIDLFLLVRFF